MSLLAWFMNCYLVLRLPAWCFCLPLWFLARVFLLHVPACLPAVFCIWVLCFVRVHFFIRNMICSIKKIAFQTQLAHPLMYCLPNRIQIETDPHIHAYLYLKKEKKPAPPLLPCDTLTFDFREDQSKLPHCCTHEHSFATFKGCVLCLISFYSPPWPKRPRVPTFGMICRLPTVTRSSFQRDDWKKEDACDLWPHLNDSLFKEHSANVYGMRYKKDRG